MEGQNAVSEVGDDIEYTYETATVRYGNYILCNDENGLRRLWYLACMTCSPKLLKEPFQWVCEEGGIVELSFEELQKIRLHRSAAFCGYRLLVIMGSILSISSRITSSCLGDNPFSLIRDSEIEAVRPVR